MCIFSQKKREEKYLTRLSMNVIKQRTYKQLEKSEWSCLIYFSRITSNENPKKLRKAMTHLAIFIKLDFLYIGHMTSV